MVNLKSNYNNLLLEELKLDEENIFLQILKIRNQKFVRENMYNNKIIGTDEHLNWIRYQLSQKTKKIFKVIFKKKLIGLIILSNISTVYKKSVWAFYLSKDAQTGLGALVEYKFLNLFFTNSDFENLNCEVLEFNKSVINLHKKFGFEVKNIIKNRVVRNGMAYNAIFMRINKNKWQISKKKIEKKLKL